MLPYIGNLLASTDIKRECCQKKRYGSDTYMLIDSTTSIQSADMNKCLSNCAYRKRDNSDQIFCFQHGNQSSPCLEGTSLEQGASKQSGYIGMENKIVCGDFWDLNAAAVACRELGHGRPREVFASQIYGT